MTEAQESTRWIPPVGPLGELTEASRARAAAGGPPLDELRARVAELPSPPSLRQALRTDRVALIAEIKRQSPSKGVLAAGLDAAAQARIYEEGGAAALSVLTEPSRFGGSLADLSTVRQAVSLPLLRKDFITHERQLLEARLGGASAVLLIARALAPDEFRELAARAQAIGLELLLETRDEHELARALAVSAAVIGVNNRDLETLVIDDAVSARLIPMIPEDRIAVYESGITDRSGVERAAALGADAVLVGSSLTVAAEPLRAVRWMTEIPRRSRG